MRLAIYIPGKVVSWGKVPSLASQAAGNQFYCCMDDMEPNEEVELAQQNQACLESGFFHTRA